MQSRKVDNTFGRRLVRLVAVATLFFSVAIPKNGFAKPDGDPSDKEVKLWHEVWKDKKWQESYMEKFSAEDLKADSDKMKAWMKQLEKKDEKLNTEFVSKFVVEPDTKNEISQPFKMAQALASVLIERTKKNIADNSIQSDDDKKKAFEAESEKLWKWLSDENVQKAFGSKYKSFMKLLAKLLSSAKDGKKFKADGKDVKGVRPDTWKELEELLAKDEDFLKALFEDEDKLGEEFQKHPKKESETPEKPEKPEKPEQPEKPVQPNDNTEAFNKMLQDFLKQQQAQNAALLAGLQQAQQPGVGEQVDLNGLRNAVLQACAQEEQDDEQDDIEALARLADQLQNAINDDENDRNRNDINDLLGALDQNDDEDQEEAQQAALTPPAAAAPPSEQPQLAQGDEGTPQIPQRQEIPPQPQPFLAQQPGDIVKAPANNTGFSGPSFDYGDDLISATQRMIRNNTDSEDDLLQSTRDAMLAYAPLPVQLKSAKDKKYAALGDYRIFKGRRDLHEQKAESLRKQLQAYEKGFQQEFASANPQAAETLRKMEANEKELAELVKSEQQRAQQAGPQGPAFDPNQAQQAIAQLKKTVSEQKAEKDRLTQLRDSFIGEKDKEIKSAKAAYDKHLELAQTAKEQMDRAKSKFSEAESTEQMLMSALAQQQQPVGAVPNVNGSRQVTTGTNRFNTPGFTAATPTTAPTSSVVGTDSGSGEFRGRLSGQR